MLYCIDNIYILHSSLSTVNAPINAPHPLPHPLKPKKKKKKNLPVSNKRSSLINLLDILVINKRQVIR